MFVSAATNNTVHPVVKYWGEEITEGMEIPESAWLSVSWRFEAYRGAIDGTFQTIKVPKFLKAEDGSFDITATGTGGTFDAGIVTVENGNITIHYGLPPVLPVPDFSDDPDEDLDEPLKGESDEDSDKTSDEPSGKESDETNSDSETSSENESSEDVNKNSETPSENKSSDETNKDNETPSEGQSENKTESQPENKPAEGGSANTNEPTVSQSISQKLFASAGPVPFAYFGLAPSAYGAEYDELLTIEFEIWCTFDLSAMPEPDEDGVRHITIMSGGKAVAIKVTTNDGIMPLFMPFAGGFKLEDAVNLDTPGLDRADPREEIKDGDSVSYNEALILRYKFDADFQQSKDIEGNSYILPLPAGLKWGVQINGITLAFTDGTIFGSVSLIGDVATVTFEGEFWDYVFDPGWVSINDGWIELTCMLDEDATKDQYVYDIKLAEDKSVSVRIVNNKKEELVLQKSGIFTNNQFTWRITYIPGEEPVEYPLTIRDTFYNQKHIFVEDSMKISVSGGAFGVADIPVTTSGITTSFEYSIGDDGADKPIVIEFRTRLSDSELKGADGKPADNLATTVENTVEIFESDNSTPLAERTATVTASSEHKRWITKTGTQTGANGRYIEWTVTINSLDRDLRNLIMYDKLPDGLELVPGSVEVTDQGMNPYIVEFNPASTPGGIWVDETSKAEYSFRVIFPESGPYTQRYIVKYTTEVDPKYFNNPAAVPPYFNNKAWLSFDWRYYGGTGEWHHHRIEPYIDKPYSHITNIIKKTPVSYNRAKQKIRWHIEVNPYGVNITGGAITDNLFANGQSYAGDFQILTGSGVSTNTLTGAGLLVVNVDDIGTGRVAFAFDAYVTSPADYAGNIPNGKPYLNRADFEGTVNGVPGVTDSAIASISVRSQMLTKVGAGFGYTDQLAYSGVGSGIPVITWRITVNQNQMPLRSSPEIIDTLPAGLTYLTGSAVHVDGSTNTRTPYAVSHVSSGGVSTLTIPLTAGATDTHTFEYQTVFDPEDDRFKECGQFTVTNSARLRQGSYPDVVVEGSQIVHTRVLSKTHVQGTGDDQSQISYTVRINPKGVELENKVLTDTLDPGLRLDITSLRLYKADIDAQGRFATETAIAYYAPGEMTTFTAIFGFVDFPEKFTIKLPDGPHRYLLKYDCYIVPGRGADERLKNTISASGAAFSADVDDASDEVRVGGGGGGTSSRMAKLTLTLIDKERHDLTLSGVVFQVRQKVGTQEIPVMTVTTNANGKVELFPLSAGAEYIVTQTNFLAGYSNMYAGTSGAAVVDGLFTSGGITADTMNLRVTAHGPHELTVTNDPRIVTDGKIEFTVTSDKDTKDIFVTVGAFVAGFEITDITRGRNTLVAGGPFTTDAQGKVLAENLPFGEYRVRQITWPPYHTQAADFTIIIDADGVTTYPPVLMTGPPHAPEVRNVYFRPGLTIRKFEGSSDTPKPDVAFNLIYIGGVSDGALKAGDIKATATTAAVTGEAIFTDLYGGSRYRIEEVGNPLPGYYRTGVHEVYVDPLDFDPNPVIWKNYRHDATLTVTVIDAVRPYVESVSPGVRLSGVVFELYEDPSFTTRAGIGTSDSDGIIRFTGLEMTQATPYTIADLPNLQPTTYWLKEITAPIGYAPLSAQAIAVTLSGITYPGSGTATVGYTPLVTNASFSFTKYSDKGNIADSFASRVSGAAFRMTDLTTGSALIIDSNLTTSNGAVTFNNVLFGRYRVEEIRVPYYHSTVAAFYVTIGTNGICTEFPATVNPGQLAERRIANRVFRVSAFITTRNADAPFATISGIEFAISGDADGVSTPAGAGIAKFEGLLGGDSYTITQTTVPPGYYTPKTTTFAIGVNQDVNLDWKLYPHAASITIVKRDTMRPGINISGAAFTLYPSGADGLIDLANPIGNAATNANGVARFDKLALTQDTEASWSWNSEPVLTPTTYWVVETDTPSGYIRNSTPVKVELKSRTYKYMLPIHNDPVTGSVEFTKISADAGFPPLGGAEFKLIDKTTNSTFAAIATSAAVTGTANDGKVIFENIPFGTYELKETYAPSPYVRITDTIDVIIDSSGTVTTFTGPTGVVGGSLLNTLTVTNEPSNAFFQITAINASTDAVMPGILFTIARETASGSGIWTTDQAITTSAVGVVTFAGLYPGDRYLVTADIPSEFYQPEAYIFTAVKNDTIVRNWYSHPVRYGSITITKLETDTPPGRNIPIPGAVFTLSSEAGIPLGSSPRTTNANGTAVFSNLPLGDTLTHGAAVDASGSAINLFQTLKLERAYTVTQTTAAQGYALYTTPQSFTLTETATGMAISTNLHQSGTLRAAPQTPGAFTFSNVNTWNFPLSGAEFLLTDTTSVSVFTATRAGIDGTVSFANIPFGTYTLTQTRAPDGPRPHDINNTVYNITVGTNGLVTSWDLPNLSNLPIFLPTGSVVNTFQSTSASITLHDNVIGTTMAGVAFTITTSFGGVTHSSIAYADGSGVFVFDGLMQGMDYTITKTTPLGYYPSAPHSITLAAATDVDWIGYPGHGEITVNVKCSRNGSDIIGAEFDLFRKSDGPPYAASTVLATAVSGVNGELTFSGIPLETSTMATYSTPPDLSDDDNEFVVLQRSTVLTHTFPNAPIDIPPFKYTDPTASIDVENDPRPAGGNGGGGGGGNGRPDNALKPDDDDDDDNGDDTQNVVSQSGPDTDENNTDPVDIIKREDGEIPPAGVAYCTPLDYHEIPHGYMQVERICPETGETYYILEPMVPYADMELADRVNIAGVTQTGQTGQGFLWLMMMLSGAVMLAAGRRGKGKEKQTQEK